MRRILLTALLLIALAHLSLPARCFSADKDTLFQVATIDSLLQGVYNGFFPCASLPSHGDIGLGTFTALDGEMVVVDGKVYQVKGDGSVVCHTGDMATPSTPFACVTFFEPDIAVQTGSIENLEQLKSELDKIVAAAPNMFFAFKATGRFRMVHTRSVRRQQQPWPPLTEAVRNQPEFEFKDVQGDVVGFYCPPFVKGINVPGWHLHFLNASRDGGGHILNLAWGKGAVAANLDATPGFNLLLPQDAAFQKALLGPDRQKALNKVE